MRGFVIGCSPDAEEFEEEVLAAGLLLWKFSKFFSTNGILLALADLPLELHASESTIE